MRRALAFLTPLGKSATPSGGALMWFPVVGALVGLCVGGVWWLAGRAWPAVAAAAVAVAADACITGFLHLDGLADSADGLLPPLDRHRRLDVMADPAVGAFGLVVVLVVLLMRYGGFAAMRASPLAIAALWCGSRTAMAVVARAMPYARPGGLASAFIGGADGENRPSPERAVAAAWGVIPAVVLALLGRGLHGLASLGGEVLGVCVVIGLAKRRLGGFTGDVLGAAGVVGETLGLLVLASRW